MERPPLRDETREVWEVAVLVEEAAMEVEVMTAVTAAVTVGEAATSLEGLEVAVRTRETTRDSPSTGEQAGATGTRDPPGAARGVTCRAAPATAWPDPATAGTRTTGPILAVATGPVEDSGGRGEGAGTRTEGINAGVDDDVVLGQTLEIQVMKMIRRCVRG